MRIDKGGIDSSKDISAPSATEGKKRGIARRKSDVDTSTSTNVEISSKAKGAALAEKVAKATPDMNEEKIARLKAAIESGTYKTDAKAIADRLVDEHLTGAV